MNAAPVTPEVERAGYTDARFGFFTWCCVGWLALLAVVALLAPWLPFVDGSEDADLSAFSEGPSLDHWFGVDEIGRDVFARVVWGARMSLFIGLSSTVLALIIGGLLGFVAGYRGGRFDSFVAATVDIALAVPTLVLLLFVVAVWGRGLPVIILALTWLMVPFATRILRAATLAEVQLDYIMAARVLGARDRRIIQKELLPAVVPVLLTLGVIILSIVILVEGTLAFIGLSIPPPTPTWGSSIADGRHVIDASPHITLFPSAVMVVTLLAINVIGDALQARSGQKQRATI